MKRRHLRLRGVRKADVLGRGLGGRDGPTLGRGLKVARAGGGPTRLACHLRTSRCIRAADGPNVPWLGDLGLPILDLFARGHLAIGLHGGLLWPIRHRLKGEPLGPTLNRPLPTHCRHSA